MIAERQVTIGGPKILEESDIVETAKHSIHQGGLWEKEYMSINDVERKEFIHEKIDGEIKHSIKKYKAQM